MTKPLPYRPCAGVVLTDGKGRVWAGERIDTPGAWQMPQGGIDKGEEPLKAALREPVRGNRHSHHQRHRAGRKPQLDPL